MSNINFCNTKEQLNHLGEVVTGKVDGSPTGADIETSTLPYTGQIRKTLPALEAEYLEAIRNAGGEPLNGGVWSAGQTFTAYNQFMVYNDIPYKPLTTTPLPYGPTGATPDTNFVGPYESFSLQEAAQVFGNKNELSNSNFLTPSPDAITPPSATQEAYAAGTQIFSGVYAGPSGATITLINGRVNCTAGDYQFKLANTGGLERVPAFTSSVSDYDGIPKEVGVSHALVGNEYVVTVTPAAGDVFSVKLEQGSVATGHCVAPSFSDLNSSRSFTSLEVAIKSSTIRIGDTIDLKERVSGSRGGGTWDAVDVTTVTPNTFDIVASSVLSDIALVLRASEGNIRQYGAVDGGDNTAIIQAAINAHTVINLDDVKGTISDQIEISKPVIMYGKGLDQSIHTRDYNVNTGINPYGILITSANARNSVFRDFQLAFSNMISGEASPAHIAFNNGLANNVTLERCRFDGGNLGVYYRDVAGGVIQFCQVANMVLADNGVTGYGINTDGSDGVTTFKNSITQCERHGIYLATTTNPSKNQRHIANDIRWSGAASPASQQACIKVIDGENNTFIGNTGVGLQKAYWLTGDVDGFFAYANSWTGMTVRGLDNENADSKVIQNANVNDNFKDITGEGVLIIPGVGGSIARDLNMNGSKFINCEIGIVPTACEAWTYDKCVFDTCTTGISVVAGVTAPPLGLNDAKFINCGTNLSTFPSGGGSDLSGSATPSVGDGYNDYYVANSTTTTITDFIDGYHGFEFTLLFLQGTANTTIQHGGSIYTKSGADVTPASNQIMKFKNIRGSWREI